MKSSKIVEEQYLSLKNKVENQIKALQQKLATNSTIRYHRSLSSKMENFNLNLPSPNQNYQQKQYNHHIRQHHRHCCHSHYHCRHYHHQYHNCSSNHCSKNNSNNYSKNNSFRDQQHSKDQILQTSNPINLNISKTQQNKQANQNKSRLILEEALAKSLQNQKELAQNLKILNEKIQKLSESRSMRNSQIQKNHLNISQINKHCLTSKSSSNIRAKSQINQDENPVLKQYSRQNNFIIPHIANKRQQSTKNKLRRLQKSCSKNIQYLYHVRSQKNIKAPSLSALKIQKQKSVSKKSQNLKDQYFQGHKICPIHSQPKVNVINGVQKEIYKDSQHRNRKHQRDHLLQSFRQQQIARKKLIAKITQNGFHNYGAK